jgi:hypothetical protein
MFASSTQRRSLRIPVSKKTLMNFLSLILLLFIASFLVVPSVISQDEPQLIIEVYDSNDWNESTGTIVFEGRSYDIMASTENETVIMEVNITVLGSTYRTNVSEPFVTVTVPPFEQSDSLSITATKGGYQPDAVELTVLKGELSIMTNRTILNEKTQFQITVTDQDNHPVDSALVYVTENAQPIQTNQLGKTVALAPDVEASTAMTIQVIKSGYLSGSTTIHIENVDTSIFNLTESKFLQILPVLLAVLVVIISILYVFLRQKKDQTKISRNAPTEAPDEPPHTHKERQQRSKTDTTKYPVAEKRNISTSTLESRVEEIRIPVQSKKKETTILAEEKAEEQVTEDEEKHPDEWFKGQDYMRYKIDELTGKIDQNTDGKWFEGEQVTKDKVDEALKKNLKKKKIDEDSVE